VFVFERESERERKSEWVEGCRYPSSGGNDRALRITDSRVQGGGVVNYSCVIFKFAGFFSVDKHGSFRCMVRSNRGRDTRRTVVP